MRWWLEATITWLMPEMAREPVRAMVVRRVFARMEADRYAFFLLWVKARPLGARQRRAFRRQLKRVARAHGASLHFESGSVWPSWEPPPSPYGDPLGGVESIRKWEPWLTFHARPPGKIAYDAILEWLRTHPDVLEAHGSADPRPQRRPKQPE